MLGVPVNKPTLMLGDNTSVILNTTAPSSQLKKKHKAIAYHRVHEAIAGKIVTFVHTPSKDNLADILTKPLPNAQLLGLVWTLLFRKPLFGMSNESGTEGTDRTDGKGMDKELALEGAEHAPEGTELRGDIVKGTDKDMLDQEGASTELRGAKCANKENTTAELRGAKCAKSNAELLCVPDKELLQTPEHESIKLNINPNVSRTSDGMDNWRKL
jgi:hypothetical protein